MYPIALCLSLLWVLFAGQVCAQSAPALPERIYVADFDLEVDDIHEEQGLLPRPLGRQGPGGRIRSLGRTEEDPQKQAREMVNLMSDSLVGDLEKLGYSARRLVKGEPLPPKGLLMRGLFVNVDEGNRLRRAAIGFGAGHTDLQVVVSVSSLGKGEPEPFYEANTGAQRGKMPGAVVTLNPYVAAAKFVLAGKDMKKGITQTASKIASDVDKRVRSEATKTGTIPRQPGN